MKGKINNKGFTLVEILVVLMIVTIVMALAGSIVLSSFNLFGTTTQDDLSKRSLDSIVEYVKSEITYAGDIRISTSKPEGDDWIYLDIVNDKLVENFSPDEETKEEKVYQDAIYYGNELAITLSDFVDNKQFDMSFTFKKKNYESYVVKITVRLPNIILKMKTEDDFKPFNGLNEDEYLLSGNVRLYYKRYIEKTEPKKEDTSHVGGTVADQIDFLNNYNNREFWDKDAWYRKGDMVYFEGSWWYCLVDNATNIKLPGNNNCEWKKIDAKFHSNSGYQKGDVIIFEGSYYRAKQDIIQTNYNPIPTDQNSNHWELIGEIGTESADNTVTNTRYTNLFTIFDKTVRNKLGVNLEGEVPNPNIPVFEPSKLYNKWDIVKVYASGYEGDNNLATYYECTEGNNHTTSPDKDTNYNWKRLSIMYYSNSAYEDKDTVYLNKENGMIIEAQSKIREPNDPHNDIYQEKGSWKKVS